VPARSPGVPSDDVRQPSRSRTVLVVGTDEWAIDRAAHELEATGIRVLRCHEPGEPAFPCNAMIEGRTCPLDVGFALVADVRSRAVGGLAQSELGVVCGSSTGRPVVIAGVSKDLPVMRWFGRAVDMGASLTSVCEEVLATIDPMTEPSNIYT
jgi:hypothetical protein